MKPIVKKITVFSAVACLVVVLIFGYFMWQSTAGTSTDRRELHIVTTKVEKLIILPKGEDPVLATVTDKDKLLPNTFLANVSETGDKVLIFAKAKRVIVYRPSINKIVDVGPVTIQSLNEGQATEKKQ